MVLFCTNCGNEVDLPEGMTSGFCGNCGTKVELEAPVFEEQAPVVEESAPVVEESTPIVEESAPVVEETAPVVDETAQIVEETTPVVEETAPAVEEQATVVENSGAAAKKLPAIFQNKMIIALIAAAVLILILGTIGVAALLGAFGNGSYESAESKTFDALFAANDLGGISDGYKYELTSKYKPSRALLDQLSYISEDFEDIDVVTLSAIISIFDNKALADVSGDVGDYNLHAVGAFDGTEATVSFPEVSDYYLAFISESSDDEDLPKLNYSKLQKTMKNIEKEYFKIAERSSEVKKNEDLTGGDITVKADKYTFKFTNEDYYKFQLFVIEEIRKNDNLMEYITKAGPKNEDGYYDDDYNWVVESVEDYDFEGVLDDYESDIDDMLYDLSDNELDDTMLRMTAWVYKGNIVSRTIDNIDGSNVGFSYTVLANTKNAYLKMAFDNGSDSVKLTGNAEREGGSWNGNLRLTTGSDSTSAKLSFKNVTLSGEIISGDFTLSGQLSGDEHDFDIELSKVDGGQHIEIEGVYDEVDLGSLALDIKTTKINSLKLPKYDESDRIDYEDIYSNDDMRDRYEEFQEDFQDYFRF
jgi:predicted  nucleic acid-binding Zn-ribbon protein